MNSNKQYPYELEASSGEEETQSEQISTSQLERLVQLLDERDVSEIEVRRADAGMRLVLRKAKAPASDDAYALPIAAVETTTEKAKPKETTKPVPSPLVGIFHTWARPKGKPLVAVGDRVKVGQLVGTIQSLNVLVEVESAIAGRIVEILTQDGQAVEYGQSLMIVDSSEEA